MPRTDNSTDLAGVPEKVTTKCRELNIADLYPPEEKLSLAAGQIEDARLSLLTAAKLLDGVAPRDIHQTVAMLMDGCRDAQARLGEHEVAGDSSLGNADQVLAAIRQSGEVTAEQIDNLTGIFPVYVERSLEKLEAAGYITYRFAGQTRLWKAV